MYHLQGYMEGDAPYHDEVPLTSGYGYNYPSYPTPAEAGLKGRLEQKYWKGKQKMMEKLGKDQDEFVIAGDAEVDARLEAFQHIHATCMMLMSAIEAYQNRIFGLSQDENEMGRFLKEHGSSDKTKAGKMMIAVGKAQSFAAQQRLSLRVPLVRLFQEIETFRLRAVEDTAMTVQKMETARSEYRSKMLWMADVSRELDPDVNRRLGKFREVQAHVKEAKHRFEKLKLDVVQKIDLLSASRCNLLSATLEPYQCTMLKFLEATSKHYTSVYDQYKGHPSYQFHVLKHILPNNGIVDEDDVGQVSDKGTGKVSWAEVSSETVEKSVEATETDRVSVDDSKLISFDASPSEGDRKADLASSQSGNDADLLSLLSQTQHLPSFGSYVSSGRDLKQASAADTGFEDLLCKFEQNNLLPASNYPLVTQSDILHSNAKKDPLELNTVDDILFGSSVAEGRREESDLEMLSGILNNQSLGISDCESQSSFSNQWQSLFGSTELSATPVAQSTQLVDGVEVGVERQLYMPSFLMEQMRRIDPVAGACGAPHSLASVKDSSKSVKTPPANRKSGKLAGKDMSKWFDLFADLDPLSNPDSVGGDSNPTNEKQAC